MKFIHLADLHLGKSLGAFDLIDDQRYIVKQILELAKEEAVDAVLIAGDVYDKTIPSEAAVNLLDDFLHSLSALRIKTFMISGNHDSDDRLNFGSRLFESNDLYIASRYKGSLYKKTLTDAHGEVNIYLLPFVKASYVRHYHPEAEIASYEDAVKTVLAQADIDPDKRNILVAHQFVAGKSVDPELGGSEGPATQNVGLVEKIGYACFDAFDYVALGHIHAPQKIGRTEVRYAGSPLKYSLRESESKKSIPLVSFDEKGNISIDFKELKPLRDLRHLKGSLKEILDPAHVTSPEDFIYVTLTDDTLISNVMGILQQTYPNTLKVDYDNMHSKELAYVDISKIAGQKSYDELIGEFYEKMYGTPISEEEMAIMLSVGREAGVVHETD